jgi:NAD dependent epimerase/dehydratase family enzyme
VPGFAFQLAFGEVSTIILNGQRVMPAALQAAGYKFQFSEVRAALQDLLG